jgi:hypothetical protein
MERVIKEAIEPMKLFPNAWRNRRNPRRKFELPNLRPRNEKIINSTCFGAVLLTTETRNGARQTKSCPARTWRHMAVEGVQTQLLSFLTSALDGRKWSASRPGRFTLGGRATQCSSNRRLGEPPRRHSGRTTDMINLLLFRESNHDSSGIQPVA